MGDTPAERTAYRDWERTLLDTDFSLDASYVPPELASTTEAGFVEDLQVRPFVIEHLAALRAAAEAVGTPVALIAAYRSYEDQQLLFDQRVVELGQEEAESKVARAGHSEHQLGTAVDFKLPDHADVTERFATTGGGKWLAENAWQYGFILSFPDELRATTCYGFEPWHYRYFGIEMARAIRESGLTSREYLWSLQSGVTP